MKKKSVTSLNEIIPYYGSLKAYNEEQRGCGLVTLEAARRDNPSTQPLRIENAMALEAVKVVKPQPWPFWFSFSVRRHKVSNLISYSLIKPDQRRGRVSITAHYHL